MQRESEHVKLYNGKDEFVKCTCSDEVQVVYSFKHNIKPLPLPEALQEAIEAMLWYAPNVTASYQSFNNSSLT